MYKGFIKDVVNARDIAFLYIVESPGEAWSSTPVDDIPLYAERVHMLDGMTNDVMNSFL